MFKKLLAAIIAKNPKSKTELDQAITKVVKYNKDGGAYEWYITERAYVVPADTPYVPIDFWNKIGLKLTDSNVTTVIDHFKFILLENGGSAVKTSDGNSVTITYKNEPNLYKENTGIVKNEYQSLFGFDRDEYLRRCAIHNAKVVALVDAEVDANQESLDNLPASLLDTGNSVNNDRPSWKNTITQKAISFMERLRNNWIRSEFDYRRSNNETELKA